MFGCASFKVDKTRYVLFQVDVLSNWDLTIFEHIKSLAFSCRIRNGSTDATCICRITSVCVYVNILDYLLIYIERRFEDELASFLRFTRRHLGESFVCNRNFRQQTKILAIYIWHFGYEWWWFPIIKCLLLFLFVAAAIDFASWRNDSFKLWVLFVTYFPTLVLSINFKMGLALRWCTLRLGWDWLFWTVE